MTTARDYARGRLRTVPWRLDKAGSMLPGRRWKDEATSDLAKVFSWAPLFAAGLTAVVVPEGKKVLDVDHPELLNGYALPEGGAIRTGGRGAQYWIADTGRGGLLPNGAGEIKGPGSIVVVPGGSDKYSWATDARPWDDQPPAPDWVKATARATFEDLDVDEPITGGERNTRLYDLAQDCRGIGFQERKIYAALRGENSTCDPKLEDVELRTIAHSAALNPPGFHKNPKFVTQERTLLERHQPAWPEPPDDVIYRGLAGEVVNAVREYTEADPVALLVSLLATFSAFAGKKKLLHLSGDPQASNVFCALVGPTGFGRKGTSFAAVLPLFRMMAEWDDLMISGIQSGEAMIRRLEKRQGLEHGSLMYEPEFGSLLVNIERQDSILSQTIRRAFDGERLVRETVREYSIVTDHHVALLVHVTPEELRERLTIGQAQNGFANRVAWFAVRKPHDVTPAPDPAPFVKPFSKQWGEAVYMARRAKVLEATPRASRYFTERRPTWDAPKIGLHGAVTARRTTLLTRFALIYALLDRSAVVTEAHLKAAEGLVEYASRSALHVFGDLTGSRYADMLREFLRSGGTYEHSALMRAVGMSGPQMYEGLLVLRGLDLIREWRGPTGPKGGRPPELVSSTEASEVD